MDESGDHLLWAPEQYEEDSNKETHCTLVGVILDSDQKRDLKTRFSALKNHFWNTDKVIFHSVEIRHRQGAFAIFHHNPDLYDEFKAMINEITAAIRPVVICSSIDKKLWVEKYPRKLFFNDDPYEQAFVFLIERYTHFLNSKKKDGLRITGKISVEKRATNKDKDLKQVFASVKSYGTQYVSDDADYDCLSEKMNFYTKGFNVPGLQLSDYFCYPFYIDHKYPRRENEHYDFIQEFIYPGEYSKYGHKKWPI